MKVCRILFLLICNVDQFTAFYVSSSSSSSSSSSPSLTQQKALADYSSAAASLFGNMITPASILGGSIIPLGFAAPLSIKPEEDDGKFALFLRKAYPFAAIITFASQLLSVIWAAITVNQLTEQKIELAASVWDLIQRDYALPWAAVNTHFILGMLSFMWTISSKAYFLAAKGTLGKSILGLGLSSFLYIISIVNRAVATGGGETHLRFGKSILSLFTTYISLLWKRACVSFGILEAVAMSLAFVSLLSGLRSILQDDTK